MRCKTKRIAITTFLAILMSAIPVTKVHKAYATRTKAKALRVGKASWYSQRSPGIRRRTANNEIFNDKALTAAMWGVQFNQKVRVTNLDNGKSVIVRINDRGPHRRYVRTGRIIDLTERAFSLLGSKKNGLMNVQLELL